MGKKIRNPPKIFRVNWFRTDENSRFMWPGFGENLRVLKWILERCAGKGEAQETPIGYVPAPGAIDRKGIDVSDAGMSALLKVDKGDWVTAVGRQKEFFDQFGSRLPAGIAQEHKELARRVGAA
jgi:phosphoenolpyruvate carboxykinase (GTP)